MPESFIIGLQFAGMYIILSQPLIIISVTEVFWRIFIVLLIPLIASFIGSLLEISIYLSIPLIEYCCGGVVVKSEQIYATLTPMNIIVITNPIQANVRIAFSAKLRVFMPIVLIVFGD